MFGDDSTYTTEGYGSIKCNGLVFTKFDEKRGTISNSNKEVVMIAPRVRDVYVLDMTSSIKKCLHLLHMDLFRPVTPRSINHEKYTLVIVDEYSRCPVYIHNHKDYLVKFDEKADDGYLLRYSLVSKAFRVFNTRRQKTKETYHIIFDESHDAIKFSKPSVDNIFILMSPLKGAGMLTRSMAKKLSAALAPECLFVDFLSEKEPKKVSEALKHPGWVDAKKYKLNQFARNKVWTLVLSPYGKTIIGSKWV
ncbi:hypothetical protein Tco_1489506, partial [Tanacetum coccineum]